MKNEPDVHVSFFGNKTVSTKAILKKRAEDIERYQNLFDKKVKPAEASFLQPSTMTS